jgi:hypothetical protein
MLKYLRISVTALSLTACGLLIALWVRSYSWTDLFNINGPGLRAFQIDSAHGVVATSTFMSDESWEWDWFSVKPRFVPKPFRFWERNGTWVVTAPHWFIVATCVAIGSGVWVPVRRFSLRTLLIATTLVAVVLGIIVAAR